MEGVLRFQGALRFDGVFKGEIISPGSLIVGKGGEVRANIKVGSFFNMGDVVGEIHATKKVMMQAGGRLAGEIDTASLVFEEGSLFSGKCVMPEAPPKEAGKTAATDSADYYGGSAVGITPDMMINAQTGDLSAPDRRVRRGKMAALAGIAVIVVAALMGAYYFASARNYMGVSFISRYLYERAARNNPARLHAIAEAYFTDGSFPQAARVYRRLMELGQSDQITVDNLAASLEKSGAVEDAARLYEEMLKANPHDRMLLDKLVLLRNAGGNPERLTALYEKLLANQPENTTISGDLFKLYLDDKKPDKALAFYKAKIASSPMTTENLKTLANLEKQSGVIEDATHKFEQLASKNESDKESVLSLAYLSYKVGQEEKAAAMFAKLAKLDPRHTEAVVNAALAQTAKGRPSRSVEILNGVLAASPDNTRAMLGLAAAHGRLGDYPKAEQYCKQVLAIDPEYAPALNRIARVYMRQKKTLSEAERYSLSSLKYNHDLADYMDTLSEIYYLKGDYAKAADTMEKALKQRPNNRRFQEQMAKFSEAKKVGAIAQ